MVGEVVRPLLSALWWLPAHIQVLLALAPTGTPPLLLLLLLIQCRLHEPLVAHGCNTARVQYGGHPFTADCLSAIVRCVIPLLLVSLPPAGAVSLACTFLSVS